MTRMLCKECYSKTTVNRGFGIEDRPVAMEVARGTANSYLGMVNKIKLSIYYQFEMYIFENFKRL